MQDPPQKRRQGHSGLKHAAIFMEQVQGVLEKASGKPEPCVVSAEAALVFTLDAVGQLADMLLLSTACADDVKEAEKLCATCKAISDKGRWPSAHYLAWFGMWEALDQLEFSMLTQVNSQNESLAHQAARWGKHECLEVLARWDLDSLAHKNDKGETPAFYAAFFGHASCLSMLGSTLELADEKGQTPAHAAALGGHLDALKQMCTLQKALRAGDVLQKANNDQELPAHIAAREGHKDVLLALRDLGAGNTLSLRNGAGQTAAHLAAERGHAHCLQALLEVGAEAAKDILEVRDAKGKSPAHVAAEHGHSACLRCLAGHDYSLLLAQDADDQCTPAHWAASGAHDACLKVYAEFRVDGKFPLQPALLQTDGWGRTVAHWAAEAPTMKPAEKKGEDQKRCLEILQNCAATAFSDASRSAVCNEVWRSVSRGALEDLHRHARLAQCCHRGQTPAHLASTEECMTYLDSIGGTLELMDEISRDPEVLNRSEDPEDPDQISCKAWSWYPHLLSMGAKASWISLMIREHSSQEVAALQASRSDLLNPETFRLLGVEGSGQLRQDAVPRAWAVSWAGEVGSGEGLRREWLTLLSQEFVHPSSCLFRFFGENGEVAHPNPDSNTAAGDAHLSHFTVFGILCGLALLTKEPLGVDVSLAFVKAMFDLPVGKHELEEVDPNMVRNMCKPEALDLEWRFVDGGNELVPGGSSIQVCEANREAYLDRLAQHRLVESVRPQIEAARRGLMLYAKGIESHLGYSPWYGFRMFRAEDWRILVFGRRKLNVAEWRRETEYDPVTFKNDLVIQWFWDIVESWDDAMRRLLLRFATGSGSVPAAGFASLPGSGSQDGMSKFRICKLDRTGGLPKARTCFNHLLMPSHPDKTSLRKALEVAVTCTNTFDEGAVSS